MTAAEGRLRVVLDPPPELMAAIEALEPENPLQRADYARSRAFLNERVCAVVVESPETRQVVAGCFGYLVGRRLAPHFILASLPPVAELDDFLRAVHRWCRWRGVWELHLQTFCSAVTHVPALPGELARRERCEWIWPLGDDPAATLSTHHRRNVAKARKAGVVMRRSRDAADARVHAHLTDDSMARRAQRGEAVPRGTDPMEWESVLRTGAGELFQGVLDGETVTSLLVLRSGSTAYYMSAGTSPAGFSSGAAPFVVLSAAQALHAEGIRTFNLAGAGDEAPGLQRYKRDFGSEPRRLDATLVSTMPGAVRRMRGALRSLLKRRGG